ncbi:unnamed protein product [Closterium sp. NIES-65]|nr:unnamed protein product [Closterium sp. NIES-65]
MPLAASSPLIISHPLLPLLSTALPIRLRHLPITLPTLLLFPLPTHLPFLSNPSTCPPPLPVSLPIPLSFTACRQAPIHAVLTPAFFHTYHSPHSITPFLSLNPSRPMHLTACLPLYASSAVPLTPHLSMHASNRMPIFPYPPIPASPSFNHPTFPPPLLPPIPSSPPPPPPLPLPPTAVSQSDNGRCLTLGASAAAASGREGGATYSGDSCRRGSSRWRGKRWGVRKKGWGGGGDGGREGGWVLGKGRVSRGKRTEDGTDAGSGVLEAAVVVRYECLVSGSVFLALPTVPTPLCLPGHCLPCQHTHPTDPCMRRSSVHPPRLPALLPSSLSLSVLCPALLPPSRSSDPFVASSGFDVVTPGGVVSGVCHGLPAMEGIHSWQVELACRVEGRGGAGGRESSNRNSFIPRSSMGDACDARRDSEGSSGRAVWWAGHGMMAARVHYEVLTQDILLALAAYTCWQQLISTTPSHRAQQHSTPRHPLSSVVPLLPFTPSSSTHHHPPICFHTGPAEQHHLEQGC